MKINGKNYVYTDIYAAIANGYFYIAVPDTSTAKNSVGYINYLY